MVDICFYFQVHQPYRLRNFRIWDIGQNHEYYDDILNKEVMEKVSTKCYLPMNALLLKLLKAHPEFRIAFSFSGTALEQFEEYVPEVLESFRKLIDTGRVEVLSETYYHSLAFLYSRCEWRYQVKKHKDVIQKHFGVMPKVFRNTELIYFDDLAHELERMGYNGVIAEGADHVLGWRSPNFIYTAKGTSMPILFKNYRLSDDIAFRFSNRGWEEWPLTTDKFINWVNQINGNGNILNLFMDYETFGEHQWADSGIFKFMEHLPRNVLQNPDNNFVTPSDAIRRYQPVAEISIPHPVSWADEQRDLTAWVGNSIQDSAIGKLYRFEREIKLTADAALIEDWRRLTASDHFYYMCTKYFNDGDVHKYFSPYDTPYEAFIIFMNVLRDLVERVKVLNESRKLTGTPQKKTIHLYT